MKEVIGLLLVDDPRGRQAASILLKHPYLIQAAARVDAAGGTTSPALADVIDSCMATILEQRSARDMSRKSAMTTLDHPSAAGRPEANGSTMIVRTLTGSAPASRGRTVRLTSLDADVGPVDDATDSTRFKIYATQDMP